MRVALIHSQQPGNQYLGGSTGVDDSEQTWMRRLALALAPILRAGGLDVEVGPLGTSYADNVRWVNARAGWDLVLSLHSNAMGDACILWGTSAASARHGQAIMDALNAARVTPYGDVWTYNDRKVAEVADTYPPAVLLEVGQHDRADYAQWLREHITDGSYARALAGPILAALGVRTADALAAVTPTAPKEAPVTTTPTDPTKPRPGSRILDSGDGDYLRQLIEANAAKLDAIAARLDALPVASVAVPDTLTYRLEEQR